MIERITKNTLGEIMPLIRAYLDFYNVAYESDEKYREFFEHFTNPASESCQFGFRRGGVVMGFATVYFTYVTSIAAKVGVMNDLYTSPESRGCGIGRALIEHCYNYAKSKAAGRLQWSTAPDNFSAIKLYDSIGANKSNWTFYTYNK